MPACARSSISSSRARRHVLHGHDPRRPDQPADRRRCSAPIDRSSSATSPTVPPEGTLLPETYNFTRGDTRQDMLDRMMRERDRVVAEVWARRAPRTCRSDARADGRSLPRSSRRRPALADERSRVAAVFINRLRLGMRLQSDPTVIYGLFGGEGKPPATPITAEPTSTSRRRTTPTQSTACRRRRSPIPAARRSRRSPIRRGPATSSSSPTAPAAMPSPRRYEEHLRNVARWREIKRAAGERPPSRRPADTDAAAPADGGADGLQPADPPRRRPLN